MITLGYGEALELVEKLEETATLITTLGDIEIGAALDNIYDIKASLMSNVNSFEGMIDAMASEYDQ